MLIAATAQKFKVFAHINRSRPTSPDQTYTPIFSASSLIFDIFSYLVKMFISLLINGEYEVTGEKYLTCELCYYD